MLIYPYTKEKTVPVPRRGEIMRDETKMDVYTSGVTGAEYDAGMKQLMSNKEIIIPILQMTGIRSLHSAGRWTPMWTL